MNIIDTVKNNKTTLIASIVLLIAITMYFTEIQAKNDSDLGEMDNLEAGILAETNISKGDDPILGNPDAPISIIEFSDYQCPFCARFSAQILPLIKTEYIEKGKVNFIYRDFPIQNHPNARPASLASECADEQGQFWQYHDMLFERQDVWKKSELDAIIPVFKEYAKELDLDQEVFDSCLDSGKYADEVDLDFADGKSYKISGTPTFFIGNEEIGYSSVFGAKSFYEFQEIIDGKLNELEGS